MRAARSVPEGRKEDSGGVSLCTGASPFFRTAARFPMNSRGSQTPGNVRETHLPRRGSPLPPARPHRPAEGAGAAHPAWGNPSGVQRVRREFRGCRSFLTTPPATHGKPLRSSNRCTTFNHTQPRPICVSVSPKVQFVRGQPRERRNTPSKMSSSARQHPCAVMPARGLSARDATRHGKWQRDPDEK